MTEVSKQRTIATTIRGSGTATDDSVASEKAVRDAITSAAYELPNATTASAGGVTVDSTASHGIFLNIEDGLLGVSVDPATVGQIITGATAGAVTPEGLAGALSVGKAVDVTNLGTGNFDTASLPTAANFRGTFTLTKTSSSETLYYGFATFPKFAAGKKYLWLMDVTNNGSVSASMQISSGAGSEILTPLQLYPSIPAGETVRVSFVFFGNAPKFELRNSSSGGTYSLTISHCRQFEVTDLTHEAWEYLAGISDPDDLDLLYLIDECSVNPWTPILNMGTASAVAIQSGLAYKLLAQTGTHTLTVDTFPANCYGRDAHIELFVGETGAVQVQSPLILMDALTPNAVNNCTVKYRDGEARLYVDDTDYGYTVTITSGTASGSLCYGLTGSTADYVTFSNMLNGSTVAIADAATVSRNLNILGNGMENTTISGTFGPASGKIMNVQDLTISGGTMDGAGTMVLQNVVLDDVGFTIVPAGTNVIIPEGSTVTDLADTRINATAELVLNGTLKGFLYKGLKITGTGTGVLDGNSRGGCAQIGGGGYVDQDVSISDITITGGSSAASGGGVWIYRLRSATFKNCVFTNNTAAYSSRDMYIAGISNGVLLDHCVFNDAYAVQVTWGNTPVTVSGCTFSAEAYNFTWDNTGNNHAKSNYIFTGSNVINGGFAYYSGAPLLGDVYLASGCILDFTNYYGSTTVFFDSSVASASSTGEYIYCGDGVSFVVKGGGSTVSFDACRLSALLVTGVIANSKDAAIQITGSTIDPWKATNVIFASPLDASAASTVRLSGTTFTSASRISSEPMRIQLPASTTVSVRGNSAANDTDKIITAPIIVVGDTASAPAGSATVEYGTNNTSSISGIGTYIAKDGSNDFTAISNVNSVTVSSDDSSIAGTMASALALTTSSGGENRWAKLADNLSATMVATSATVNVLDKRIITNEYEPVLGGTYSISSGGTMTVDESTKTTTFSGAAIVMSNVEIPKGATVATPGGISISNVAGGGTIDFGGTGIVLGNAQSAQASGVTFTNGHLDNVWGNAFAVGNGSLTVISCTFSNGSGSLGGCLGVSSKGSLTMSGCAIVSNTATGNAGGVYVVFTNPLSGGKADFVDCIFSSNYTGSQGGAANILLGASAYFSACTFTDNTAARGGNAVAIGGSGTVVGKADFVDCSFGSGQNIYCITQSCAVTFAGHCSVDKLYANELYASATVTISSGAFLNLTSSIVPGGGITVLDGGCTVNNVAVSETGETPYSSIVNSGGTLFIDGNPVE